MIMIEFFMMFPEIIQDSFRYLKWKKSIRKLDRDYKKLLKQIRKLDNR